MIKFYNHFHNGDIHYSREFIKDIISKTNHDMYLYQHKNKNLLIDLDLVEINMIEKGQRETFINNNNIIFINTWIGNKLNWGCTLYGNYQMYKDIYNQLNIEIENIDYYIPEIDYSKYKIENIDIFLKNYKNKKVLISNGDVHSGQAHNFSFKIPIQNLAKEYNEIDFILTNRCEIDLENVFFTDDIIQVRPDLNEISYLSTFCDIIVGRSSGPYTFTHVKENLNNNNKFYIDFNGDERNVMWFGSDKLTTTKQNYVWKHTNDINVVYNTINNVIKEKIEKW